MRAARVGADGYRFVSKSDGVAAGIAAWRAKPFTAMLSMAGDGRLTF
jgi:hypothetical protein